MIYKIIKMFHEKHLQKIKKQHLKNYAKYVLYLQKDLY